METIQESNFFQLTDEGKKFLQIFLRFLKEHNYFYNYKEAFENYKAANKFDRFILSCNSLLPNIIDRTLYWAGTAEGSDYWLHVHKEFMELCYILKNNLHFYNGKKSN